MANTYVLIASNTLGSDAADITFSSIPGTYTDLVIRASIRDTSSSNLFITFNSDTNTVYSRTRLLGNGATASSARTTDDTKITAVGTTLSTYTSNTFASFEIYIPSYTASQNKPTSSFGVTENNATTSFVEANAGLWRNTAAITSIKIAGNDTLLSGSSFFLYGIKNS